MSKRAQRQAAAAAQAASGSGYFGRTHPLGQVTSGSEDLYESSMESIESNSATTGLTLHPLSALNTSTNVGNGKKLQKISSADSLMCMIKVRLRILNCFQGLFNVFFNRTWLLIE